MTSCEVPAGASRPVRDITTESGTPASISVGTSGRSGTRLAAVTESGRTLAPVRRYGRLSAMGLKITGIWPLRKASSAGAPPLNGTSCILICAFIMNSSTAMCVMVPCPAEAY